MLSKSRLVQIPVLAAAALLSVRCSESGGAGPDRQLPPPLAATSATGGIQLDQWNAAMGSQTTPRLIIKGFNPTNPRVGDAIIATFFWFGAPGGVTGNIIDSVTDVLTTNPYTPVGNRYSLVEFVTNGNVSMATYVATNVQNFPDQGTDVAQILAVKADLKVPVADAGILISAWSGVTDIPSQAVGQHRSASGTGSSYLVSGPTPASPGAISVGAGSLAYAVSMSSPPAGSDGVPGWTVFGTPSDFFMRGDGSFDARFTVSPVGGSTEPIWNWYFTAPGSWVATALSVNPAP